MFIDRCIKLKNKHITKEDPLLNRQYKPIFNTGPFLVTIIFISHLYDCIRQLTIAIGNAAQRQTV